MLRSCWLAAGKRPRGWQPWQRCWVRGLGMWRSQCERLWSRALIYSGASLKPTCVGHPGAAAASWHCATAVERAYGSRPSCEQVSTCAAGWTAHFCAAHRG